ncbi:hypothetical protein Pfo_016250 [Paulownia fortunei]|nr:hypothetical protein Pfo_016250 [Paulownia fortunei]
MEVIPGNSSAFVSLPSFVICNFRQNSTIYCSLFGLYPFLEIMLLCNHLPTKKSRSQVRCSLSSKEQNTKNCISAESLDRSNKDKTFLQSLWWLNQKLISQCGFVVLKLNCLPRLRKLAISLQKAVQSAENFNNLVPDFSLHLIVGVMLVMTFGATVTKTPSWALSEENLLFLETWRTIDRPYIDKNFNGQNAAIRKMVATLDDPFTRQSGTRNTLTGVGLSIGYPTRKDKSSSGLVVVLAAPGGPANRAGVLSGDLILAIDDTSTENMEIYDAAERLQGPEGSGVELIIRHGLETRHLSLMYEYHFMVSLCTFVIASRGVQDIYDADGNNAATASEPLAVLVNKGTVSASEILAGALKDNKRAVLFGEPTYGKGKIQSVFELSDGSGLVVTVACYEKPAHIDIGKVGIAPDRPLPVSFPKDDESFCGCLQDPTPRYFLTDNTS